MKAFVVSSNFNDSYAFIGFDSDLLDKKEGYEFSSSYHVLGARLLGLSYPDYLKYCQSKGAKLRGRKGYCYPVWDKAADKKGMQEIIRQLNTNWNTFLKEVSIP